MLFRSAPVSAALPVAPSATHAAAPISTAIPANAAGDIAPASAAFCDDSTAACDAVGMPSVGGGLACLPIWGQFEYLMWWDKDSSVPPLATTSPAGTDRASAGMLGQATTSNLFDASKLKTDIVNGGRITLGLWLDGCESFGVMGRGFLLEDQTSNFSAASTGTEILARPFFNSFTDEQDAVLLAFPGLFSGSIDITHKTEVGGAEALIPQAFRSGGNYRVDLLYRYRHVGVE